MNISVSEKSQKTVIKAKWGTMLNISTKILASAGLILLAGCAENITNKTSSEELQGLLNSELSVSATDKLNEDFEKSIDGSKSAQALHASHNQDVIENARTPNVGEVFQSVLERNSSIGSAAQEINAQEAVRLNAIMGYLPQIQTNANYTFIQQSVLQTDNQVFQRGDAEYPVITASAELNQPLLDISKFYDIKLANMGRSTSAVKYVATVQRTLFEAVDVYLEAQQHKTLAEALSRRSRLVSKQVSSENNRSKLGVSVFSTRDALDFERRALVVELTEKERQYRVALARLSSMSGLAIKSLQPVKVPARILNAVSKINTKEAVAKALQQNPEILLRKMNVVQAHVRNKRNLAADFAPIITAFARTEYEERTASRFGGGSTTLDNQFGVRLTIPIFNINGQGYQHLVSNVEYRNELLNYNAEQRTIATEILSAIETMKQLKKAIHESRIAIKTAGRLISAERTLIETGQSKEFMIIAQQLHRETARQRLDYYKLEMMRTWARYQYFTGVNLKDVF